MKPIFMPGDRLLVDFNATFFEKGDIAIFIEEDKTLTAHRIISLDPFLVKGDRNRTIDTKTLSAQGKVCGYERRGKRVVWRNSGQTFKKFFAYISKHNTYSKSSPYIYSKRVIFLALLYMTNFIDLIIQKVKHRNITITDHL